MTDDGTCVLEDDQILTNACQYGNLEVVKMILEQHPTMNTHKLNVALHRACLYGQLEIVKLLVVLGADIRSSFDDRQTTDSNRDVALSEAVRVGEMEVVKFLLENGASPHSGNILSQAKDVDMLRVLLDAGERTGGKFDEETLTNALSSENDLEMNNLLLEKGADPRKNQFGLSSAARAGRLDVVQWFLDHGADIHIGHGRAFCEAADFKRFNVFLYLLDRCGNKVHPNVLFHCVSRALTAYIKVLLDRGLVNIHENNDYALRRAAASGYTNTVKFLLDNGADIHANNDDALRLAARAGFHPTVKLLVEKGANVAAVNDFELADACERNDLETVKSLLQQGAVLPRVAFDGQRIASNISFRNMILNSF